MAAKLWTIFHKGYMARLCQNRTVCFANWLLQFHSVLGKK